MMARVPGGSVPAPTRGMCVINAPSANSLSPCTKAVCKDTSNYSPGYRGRSWATGGRRCRIMFSGAPSPLRTEGAEAPRMGVREPNVPALSPALRE